MSLTVNIATRGRPEILLNTIKNTLPNISRPDTTLMVSVDDDDTETREALHDASLSLLIDSRPREASLGTKYNRMIEVAPADVYLAMVDYAPHVTFGFDQKILDAAAIYQDGYAIVYNHLANLSFPGINALTAKFVEASGFFFPPYFPYWFNDHWIDDIGRMTGRIVFADVELDVSHRPGTQNLRDLPFWCDFFNRTATLRERVAEKVIQLPDFDAPQHLKHALINQFPLVRQRTRLVNAMVLQTNGTQQRVPDDERHERLRNEANTILESIDEVPIKLVTSTEPAGRHPHSTVFATPNLSYWVSREYYQAALRTGMTFAIRGIPWLFMDRAGDPYLDKTRNILTTIFLEDYKDYENFFFLDDDVGWPAEKALEFAMHPAPVLVGAYPKKQEKLEFPIHFEFGSDGKPLAKDGLLKVDSMAPTGFMRIKRWVLEKFLDHYGTFVDCVNADGSFRSYHEIFVHGIGDNGQFWGEDTTFVRRCKGLGIEVWCDPQIEFTHRGSYLWKANLSEHLNKDIQSVVLPELESAAE